MTWCRAGSPLPACWRPPWRGAAASPLSGDPVDAPQRVKGLVPTPAGIAAEPPLAALDEEDALAAGAEDVLAEGAADDDEDDEQPAAATATPAARATQRSRRR